MATELGEKYPVRVVDKDRQALKAFPHPTYELDVTDFKGVQSYLRSAGLVISAVPGAIGYEVLKNVIRLGKPIIDISFFPQDPFQLNELARKNNTTAIIDSGIAPGFSNLAAGYYNQRLSLTSFACLVGGLPVKRTLPWQYKAPFSPVDVLEEYTRPVRIKEGGSIVEKKPLSDYQHIETDKLGTLEAFNTDGLRTLLHTLDIPNMKEKTLRYPGHREKLKLLEDTGFFDRQPLQFGEAEIAPRQVTSHLLGNAWELDEDEEDCTYMRINLKGEEISRRLVLYDRYDREKGHTSMARCTGYTCLGIAQLYLDNKISKQGIIAPEMLGETEEYYDYIVHYLKNRGIQISDQQIEA